MHAALCAGIFALLTSATRSVWLGLCGAAIAVASGTHLYYVGEYVNNLGALALLVWGGWCALRYFQTRSISWLPFVFICLLGAIFSHRSSWAIIPLLGGATFSLHFLTKNPLTRKLRFAIALCLLLLWCAPAILSLLPFIKLPEWLHQEFLVIPKLPFSTAAIAEQIILLVVAPATLLIVLFFRKEKSPSRSADLLFGAIALWSLLLTINPFFNNRGAMGLTWRLSTLAYLQVALLVPGLIYLLIPLSRRAVIILCAFVLPLIGGSLLFSRPLGLRPVYLSERGALLYRLPKVRDELGPTPLVVTPHGDQFVVTWALGIPAQQRWPENRDPQTIYWLLYHVEPSFLAMPVTILLREKDGNFVVLAKDEVVRAQFNEMSMDERQRLLMNNSHLLDHILELKQQGH